MAKLRPNNGIYQFTTKAKYRQRLWQTVRDALPGNLKLVSSNYARSTASSYWLLRMVDDNGGIPSWITLRVATHELWLQHAQQIEVLWKDPGDFGELTRAIQIGLTAGALITNQFQLTKLDLALLYLLQTLEQHKLIWFIRMDPVLAAAHKAVPFDLKTDFLAAQLYLGDRNNANNLLIPVMVSDFQQRLATFYGRNLLFSQFTKHSLMKLLPTNQWLQPMLREQEVPTDWQRLLVVTFGENFVQTCLKLMA